MICAAVVLAAAPAMAQQGAPLEYRKLAREIFKELVETNTTQAFGTTVAAKAMAERLRAAGVEDVQLVGANPQKQNLVARIRGKGTARPIVMVAHLDVVEARREDWSVDPFVFLERDGYFYGRGTTDIKNEAADLVAAMIRLKREGFVPDRDIILALTADEEAGDANGVQWLLANRRDLIDAAFCINTDAGGGQIQNGRRIRMTVQTSEKVYLSFRLEVKNKGGHSSLPERDNAIYRLADGLTKIARFEFPVKVNETTRAYFTRIAEQEAGQLRADLLAASRTPPDAAALARLSTSPYYNALMRTTCVATMLEAGHAENALPQSARAILQCRLLPDDSPAEVRQTIVRVLADDQIAVTPLTDAHAGPASPIVAEVMQPLERVTTEMWPGVPVVPVMDPWSSDSLYLRQAGIPVYCVSGMFLDIDDVRAHGKDERIGVASFDEGVEFMYRFVKALAGGA